jgi:hypothetical protein
MCDNDHATLPLSLAGKNYILDQKQNLSQQFGPKIILEGSKK